MWGISLKNFNFYLLLFGVLVVSGFEIYAGEAVNILSSLFFLLGISPYLILLFVSYRSIPHRWIITVSVLSVLCVASAYFYFDSLFVHPDAQGALIFLFLPLYQIFGILIGFGISVLAGYIQKRI